MAQRPWAADYRASVREAAGEFQRHRRREYGAIRWFTNGGEVTRARILSDLDPGPGGWVYVREHRVGEPPETPVPFAGATRSGQVRGRRGEETRHEGLDSDEGNYPSGLAGGLINTEYPQLRMQAIVADLRASVAAGQTLSLPLPPGTLGVFSVKGSDQAPG